MFYRVLQVSRFGNWLPKTLGDLEACKRLIRKEGGTLQVHCPTHGWVKGVTCSLCRAAGHG